MIRSMYTVLGLIGAAVFVGLPGHASACDAGGYYVSDFKLMLEGAVDPAQDDFGRMDKVGNACRILASAIVGDEQLCTAARSSCEGREDRGILKVQDPWRPDESIDITCPEFAALACGGETDVQQLTEACRAALVGETHEDPFFITPGSFLCSLIVTGALTGAGFSTGTLFPEHSEQIALLGAGTSVIASIGCAAIPF